MCHAIMPAVHTVGGWCNLGCVPHTLQPTRRACPLHVAREAGESGGVGGRCRVFREFHTLASLIRIYVLPCPRLTGTSPVTLARFPPHTTADETANTRTCDPPKDETFALFYWQRAASFARLSLVARPLGTPRRRGRYSRALRRRSARVAPLRNLALGAEVGTALALGGSGGLLLWAGGGDGRGAGSGSDGRLLQQRFQSV